MSDRTENPPEIIPSELTPDELLESIVEEFTQRLRSGEKPSIEAYCEQYSSLKGELEELLSSAAMIEELKASRSTNPISDLSEVNQLTSIGDYDLVRELGRGGMGVVFEGVHRSLGRKVAVKIVPRRILENQNYLARFEREAQAAANLHHTNIVSVFGVGNADGHCYYVMEFVDGANLSEVVWQISHSLSKPEKAKETVAGEPTRIEAVSEPLPIADQPTVQTAEDATDFQIATPVQKRSTPVIDAQLLGLKTDTSRRIRWAADLIMQVADGLSYAHQQGILHRDVKPSNLILDSDQRIWITDFGLVKNIADQSLTKTGDIVGTIQYMPPESFEGKYDVRSETYSLGLTLFELVCLQPYYENTTAPELIRKIMTDDPASRARCIEGLPRDLETIIRKAISREPEHRYQTASAIREDLRAFLEDRPIQARRPSGWERAVKWAKRNPLSAALAGTSAFLLLAVAIVAIISYQRLNVAYQDLVVQEKLTHDQFERADANVELAIEALGSLYRNVLLGENARDETLVDGLQELSGIETVVTQKDAALLKSMIVFYDRFAKQNENNETLELETSRALRRVANIYRMLGEIDEALPVYEQAMARFDARLKESPGSVERLIDFVRLNNEYALALQQNGALREFGSAFEVSKRMLENHPSAEDPRLQLELARTFNFMGTQATMLAATISTNSPKRRSQPIWRMLNRRRNAQQYSRFPQEDLRDRNRGEFNTREMKPNVDDEGRENDWRRYRFNMRATEMVETLLNGDPENAELQLELAKSYTLLATLQNPRTNSGDYLKKSIELFEKLIAKDPENTEAKYRLALSCVLPNTTEVKEGTRLLRRAESLIEELTENHPMVLEYQQVAVIVHAKKADLLLAGRDFDQAETHLREALKLLREITSKTPAKFRLSAMHRMLSNLYRELAMELKIDGFDQRAENAFNAAQELRRDSSNMRGRSVRTGPDRE